MEKVIPKQQTRTIVKTEDYREDMVRGDPIPSDQVDDLLMTFKHFGP